MPTPFLVDSFTDSNSTALADHDPETGGAWVIRSWRLDGSAPNQDAIIHTNRLLASGGDAFNQHAPAHVNGAEPTDDTYTVHAVIRIGSASTQIHDLGFRWSPAATSYGDVSGYYVRSDATGVSGARWQLQRVVNGTVTLLDSSATPAGQNVVVDLRIETAPGSIEVYVDDTLVLESTDDAVTQRGRVAVGPWRGSAASNYWESIEAEAETDAPPPLDPPTGLTVDVDGANLKLDWTSDEDEFVVQRETWIPA